MCENPKDYIDKVLPLLEQQAKTCVGLSNVLSDGIRTGNLCTEATLALTGALAQYAEACSQLSRIHRGYMRRHREEEAAEALRKKELEILGQPLRNLLIIPDEWWKELDQ